MNGHYKIKRIIAVLLTMAMVFSVSPTAYAKTIKLSKPKITYMKRNGKKITVKWKKVKNAKKYKVYVSTKKTKGYKAVKTTKKNKVTISKLNSNKKYYVKVRAYRGKKKSAYSKVQSVDKKGNTTVINDNKDKNNNQNNNNEPKNERELNNLTDKEKSILKTSLGHVPTYSYDTYNQTEAKKLLNLVNKLRAKEKYADYDDEYVPGPYDTNSQLTWNNTLEKAAMYWAKFNYLTEWRHTNSDDQKKTLSGGEIIARYPCNGYITTGGVKKTYYDDDEINATLFYNTWYKSIGHRTTMLGPDITQMGAAIYYGKDGMAYSVIAFYTPSVVTNHPSWEPYVNGTSLPLFYQPNGEGYIYIYSSAIK